MRPTSLMTLITLIVTGLVVTGMAAYALIFRTGGKLWFWWIAPLIVGGLGAYLIMLGAQYWFRVGRLELKGRPKK